MKRKSWQDFMTEVQRDVVQATGTHISQDVLAAAITATFTRIIDDTLDSGVCHIPFQASFYHVYTPHQKAYVKCLWADGVRKKVQNHKSSELLKEAYRGETTN